MEATTKQELLDGIDREKAAFITDLYALPEPRRVAPSMGEWSPKDLVAHLAAWERLLLGWYEEGLRGEAAVPAAGYTWSDMDRLNDDIFRAWQGATWEAVMTRWGETSAAARALVESMTDEELFTPGRYAWSGTGSAAEYAWECTGGHYAWARGELAGSRE